MSSRMNYLRQYRPALWMTLLLSPATAWANAFLPTIISANVLWALTLPLVVSVEGLLLRRWGWQSPFKVSLKANLLSMFVALPFGLALSFLGGWLTPMRGPGRLQAWGMGEEAARFLGQVLLYGHPNAPAFGFAGGSSMMAEVTLAALCFMGLCWLLTITIEGWYLAKKSPVQPRKMLVRRVLGMHLLSYAILAVLWLPYAYKGAKAEEVSMVRHCSEPTSWSEHCSAILDKYPEALATRMARCSSKAISPERCRNPYPSKPKSSGFP